MHSFVLAISAFCLVLDLRLCFGQRYPPSQQYGLTVYRGPDRQVANEYEDFELSCDAHVTGANLNSVRINFIVGGARLHSAQYGDGGYYQMQCNRDNYATNSGDCRATFRTNFQKLRRYYNIRGDVVSSNCQVVAGSFQENDCCQRISLGNDFNGGGGYLSPCQRDDECHRYSRDLVCSYSYNSGSNYDRKCVCRPGYDWVANIQQCRYNYYNGTPKTTGINKLVWIASRLLLKFALW